jgi:hypothetical protein
LLFVDLWGAGVDATTANQTATAAAATTATTAAVCGITTVGIFTLTPGYASSIASAAAAFSST